MIDTFLYEPIETQIDLNGSPYFLYFSKSFYGFDNVKKARATLDPAFLVSKKHKIVLQEKCWTLLRFEEVAGFLKDSFNRPRAISYLCAANRTDLITPATVPRFCLQTRNDIEAWLPVEMFLYDNPAAKCLERLAAFFRQDEYLKKICAQEGRNLLKTITGISIIYLFRAATNFEPFGSERKKRAISDILELYDEMNACGVSKFFDEIILFSKSDRSKQNSIVDYCIENLRAFRISGVVSVTVSTIMYRLYRRKNIDLLCSVVSENMDLFCKSIRTAKGCSALFLILEALEPRYAKRDARYLLHATLLRISSEKITKLNRRGTHQFCKYIYTYKSEEANKCILCLSHFEERDIVRKCVSCKEGIAHSACFRKGRQTKCAICRKAGSSCTASFLVHVWDIQ